MFRYLFLTLLFVLPQTALADVRLAVLEFRGVEASELLEVLADEARTGVLLFKVRYYKNRPKITVSDTMKTSKMRV